MLRTLFTVIALSFSIASQEPVEIPGPEQCPVVVTASGEIVHQCDPLLDPGIGPAPVGPSGCVIGQAQPCLVEGAN